MLSSGALPLCLLPKGCGVCLLPKRLQGHEAGRSGYGSWASSSQPAGVKPSSSLHTEPVTCQIIACSRKENRNKQCRQFIKHASWLVQRQGPDKAFSFPVSFSCAEQAIQCELRPGGEAEMGRAGVWARLLQAADFSLGSRAASCTQAPLGEPRSPWEGQGVGSKDQRAHSLSLGF